MLSEGLNAKPANAALDVAAALVRRDGAMSELTTDQVCWDLVSGPWPSSDRLLSLAVELLPGIEDEPTAGLVEELAILVTDRDEQIAAVREVQSVSLDELRQERLESRRLRDVVIELREEMRQRQAQDQHKRRQLTRE